MAYIENFPIEVTNPDGEVIQLLTSGDEFSNFIHDEWDNKIIQGDDGYYYYAYQYKEDIFPGKIRVNKKKYPKKVWKKEIFDTEDQYKRRADRMDIPQEYSPENTIEVDKKKLDDISSGPDNTLLENNSIHLGVLNNIVFFIRFADDDDNWVYNLPHYNGVLNSENNISVRNYFREVSYNKVDVVSHMFPKSPNNIILSYKDINPRSFYLPHSSINPNGYLSNERMRREHDLLMRAINALKHEIPTDLEIDSNNNGRVDSVTFICKGRASGWGSILWGHRWALYGNNVTINGKRVWDYTFQPENQATQTIISHELFHVFGAPDLYRYNNNTINPVGSWDLMASGRGHMGVWMKWKYTNQRWVTDIPTITEPGRYTIKSIVNEYNNSYRINSPTNPNEFFIIEFRNRDKSPKYDRLIPQTGLIVYRIIGSINTGNRNGPPDEVYIFRNNGTPTLNGIISQAAYNPSLNKTEISDTTNPQLHFSNGNICDDVKITNIQIDLQNDTATFDYNYDSTAVMYTISGEVIGEGEIIGLGSYNAGSTIEITAVLPTNKEIDKWEIDGIIFTDQKITMSLNSDRHIKLYTKDKVFRINVQVQIKDGDEMGYVVGGNQQYDLPANVTLEAIPNPGYEFVHWSNGLTEITTENILQFDASYRESNYSIIRIAQFKKVEEEIIYTINVSTNPPDVGTVSGGGTYTDGSQVLIKANI